MKTKVGLVLILISLTGLSLAQSKQILKANEAFKRENYNDAAELCAVAYRSISRTGPGKLEKKGEMAFKTAESYRLTERYREANEWYERALLLDYQNHEPTVYLYNADMLRMMREHDRAIQNYTKYKDLVPGDDRAASGIQSCESMDAFKEAKTRHIIENQSAINTQSSYEMSPVFGDRKNMKVYFSSSRPGSTGKKVDPRTGDDYMDLWVADLDKKGNWTEPYLLPGEEINTADNNEGTLCFDDRYKKMFFTRCPNAKKQNLGCDIWVSDAKGKTEWGTPMKIELKSHDSISIGHPCTKDGKFLIFASEMPGGFGGRDLWYTEYDRKTESWSKPKNMGPEINTKGNELFPTFGLNGDLIYASDGLPGVGGLDIFRAAKVGEENKWEKPVNMGIPINSEENDYALVERDNRFGYFTSERDASKKNNRPDIYSYELPPNLFDLKVVVSDASDVSTKLEGVHVVVTSDKGDKWEGFTDDVGAVFWDKKPTGERYINEEVSYTINIDKEGYYEDTKGAGITTVGLGYGQNFVVDMGLFPKRPIRLPEVRYHLNEWTFVVDEVINSPDSLLFVYELLEARPELVLELSSHTDSRGRNSANQKLSENRARACYKFLVEEKGIDPRRIIPVGKGEEDPRTVYLMNGEYLVKEPVSGEYETIVLTEKYINKFRSDRDKFEMLHQLNRRTEGAVKSLDFDPESFPAANEEYLKYVPYP